MRFSAYRNKFRTDKKSVSDFCNQQFSHKEALFFLREFLNCIRRSANETVSISSDSPKISSSIAPWQWARISEHNSIRMLGVSIVSDDKAISPKSSPSRWSGFFRSMCSTERKSKTALMPVMLLAAQKQLWTGRFSTARHGPANVSIPPRRTAEDTAVSAPVQFNRIICTSEKIHTTAILPYCRKKILTCFGKLRLTFRKCCSLKFSNAAGMLSIFNEKKRHILIILLKFNKLRDILINMLFSMRKGYI